MASVSNHHQTAMNKSNIYDAKRQRKITMMTKHKKFNKNKHN